MKSFAVTNRAGATATIKAHSFVTDGAGTRFYNEDGGVVASFSDSELSSVVDASVLFAQPAAPMPTELIPDAETA